MLDGSLASEGSASSRLGNVAHWPRKDSADSAVESGSIYTTREEGTKIIMPEKEWRGGGGKIQAQSGVLGPAGEAAASMEARRGETRVLKPEERRRRS